MNSFGPGALLFGEAEKRELMEVIKSGHLYRYGDGDNPAFLRKVYTLEQKIAEYTGTKHCVAVNSGTSALLTALSAAGIGPGDEVLVPGYTFIASISSIVYARAVPILVEVDESLTMDPEDLEKKITDKTKAIVPVHMLGNPCDMSRIMEIANRRNLVVIEDACQAFGATYKGKKVGSFGDIGCYSFNRFKTINSGDGGALVTNSEELYKLSFAFHDQGHFPLRDGAEMGNRAIIGLNFRMNELTGAVLLGQMTHMDEIPKTLRRNKAIVKSKLQEIDGLEFRRLNDPEGEIGTLLTIRFPTAKGAEGFAAELGGKPVYYSGWHVYAHMEQLLNQKMPAPIKCPFTCPHYDRAIKYEPGMLPQTDDLLQRSVSVGIGVIDKGNGAGFGINILSTEEEVHEMAIHLKTLAQKYV
jgi:dTDP-4-amino-4,6-dideoxygalactose transaminase